MLGHNMLRDMENTIDSLQGLCELGSEALIATDYVAAERVLEQAEGLALRENDFDTLARLYFPLQEARRQRRQRAGEGRISLSLPAMGVGEGLQARELADRLPHGLFLVAGLGSTEPGEALRQLHKDRGNYAEVMLGVALEMGTGGVATFAVARPVRNVSARGGSPEELLRALPPHSVFVSASQAGGAVAAFPETYAGAMGLFEALHRPYLAMADAMPVGLARLQAYRQVQGIDPASELAHQNAAFLCRQLARLQGG